MHPLKPDEVRFAEPVKRPWACVTVRHESPRARKLTIVPGSIAVTKRDAIFVPLPDRLKIVDEDGEAVEASKRFYISTETFSPYHIVIDKENLDNEAY